jgi:hypothetical protein
VTVGNLQQDYARSVADALNLTDPRDPLSV